MSGLNDEAFELDGTIYDGRGLKPPGPVSASSGFSSFGRNLPGLNDEAFELDGTIYDGRGLKPPGPVSASSGFTSITFIFVDSMLLVVGKVMFGVDESKSESTLMSLVLYPPNYLNYLNTLISLFSDPRALRLFFGSPTALIFLTFSDNPSCHFVPKS